YSYDENGNAKTDRMGMNLSYNYLNLPRQVTGAGNTITYLYDAGGNKLRKIANTTGQRDYTGGIEYQNGVIELIHTAEGIAYRNANGTYSYRYNLTDHLGNVRATIYRNPSTNAVEVLQRDDYYPFGLQKSPGPVYGNNKYLYNGKEKQEELGGQLDYGARFYDPVIGRWNVADPLAEKFFSSSFYNYVDNNPISRVDPDGRAWLTRYVSENGETLLNTNDGSDDVVVVPWNRTNEFLESVEYSQRMLDEPNWNENWKDELGVAISGDLLNAYGYNRLTEKGQAAAIEYLFGSRSFGSFVLQEALGQWSDPTIALPAIVSAAGAGIGSFQALSARINTVKGGKEVFNFTGKAASRMTDKARAIPIQTMDDIIKAPMSEVKDPQGTSALMHYSQMWKNGKLYNVEVLYDKATNTIMHFKYTQKPLGSLPAIK
ncbi:RHS repeat domain-containing protein, partial [Sphingobacterium spiritivorum]